MTQCTCHICGAGGGGDKSSMPYNCSDCGGTKCMFESSNGRLLPLTHEKFREDCSCDQCLIWFKKPGTVTNKLESVIHDEEVVELIVNSIKDEHDKVVDYLAGLGPEKMFFVTFLIRTDETLTYRLWARRIRIVGPIAKYNFFPQALSAEEIEELAKGVEGFA